MDYGGDKAFNIFDEIDNKYNRLNSFWEKDLDRVVLNYRRQHIFCFSSKWILIPPSS